MPGGNGTGTGSGNGPLQLNKTGSAGSGIDTSPAPQPAQMSRTASPALVPSPEMETQSRSASVSAMQQTQTIQITSQTREEYLQRTHSEFEHSQHSLFKLSEQLKTRTHDQGKKFFKWKLIPSSQMRAVTKSVDRLNSLSKRPIIPARFESDLREMNNSYLGIVQACSSYISSHDAPTTEDGKQRLEHVKKINEYATRELTLLAHNAEYYKSVRGAFLWSDVIAAERTMVYVHGQDGINVSKDGGGTSDVTVVSDGTKKLFFKEKEIVVSERPEEAGPVLIASYDEKLSDSRLSQEQRTRIERKKVIVEDMKVAIDQVVASKNSFAIRTVRNTLKDSFPAGNISREHCFLDKTDIPGMSEFYRTYEDYIEGNVTKEERDVFVEAITEFGKTFNMSYTARMTAKIDSGAELSSRNALTSRLADAFGIGSNIAESHATQVRIGSSEISGIVMADSQGISLNKLCQIPELQGKKLHYTPKALRDVMNLQLFDALCGQTDRNPSNIHVIHRIEGDDVYIDRIIGIDNDMAFGTMDYDLASGKIEQEESDNGTLRTPIQVLPSGLKLKMPLMDHAFAQRILTWKPSDIDFYTMDILSEVEREAMKSRLAGIQEDIRTILQEQQEGKEKIVVDGEEGWKAAIATLEAMDHGDKGVIAMQSYINKTGMGVEIGRQ